MTKAEYLSNSSKLFTISGILLLIATGCIYIGSFLQRLLSGGAVGAEDVELVSSYAQKLSMYGSKLSDYSYYIVLVLSALALNGEGVGCKRHRDYVNKKRVRVLKFFLAYAFLCRFIKITVEGVVLRLSDGVVGFILSKIFLGFFNTSATYSFLFMLLSLMYSIRDAEKKSVFVTESLSFLAGLVYALYRSFYYAVTKYYLMELGESFASIFSNEAFLHILSIIQYSLFVVMCFAVRGYYNSKVLDEHDQMVKRRKNMLVAPKIYNTDLVGVDYLEDDFLVKSEED